MRNLLLVQSPLLLWTIIYILSALAFIFKSWVPVMIMIPLIVLLFYFYRFPDRPCQSDDHQIISPADGTVKEITINPITQETKISLFLSPLDVHVQYIPYSGQVIQQKYQKGTFNPAYLLQKSQYNERNTITILTRYGPIKVTQIAGQLARRIVSKVHKGDQVQKGDPYGMIKLSSRVDIVLPPSAKVLVQKGDHLKGCQTILGHF